MGLDFEAMHRSCAQWGEAVTLVHGPKEPSSHVNGCQGDNVGTPTISAVSWAQQGLVVQLRCVEGQSHKGTGP